MYIYICIWVQAIYTLYVYLYILYINHPFSNFEEILTHFNQVWITIMFYIDIINKESREAMGGTGGFPTKYSSWNWKYKIVWGKPPVPPTASHSLQIYTISKLPVAGYFLYLIIYRSMCIHDATHLLTLLTLLTLLLLLINLRHSRFSRYSRCFLTSTYSTYNVYIMHIYMGSGYPQQVLRRWRDE